MQIDLSSVLVAMLLMLTATCVVKLLDNTPMRVQILSSATDKRFWSTAPPSSDDSGSSSSSSAFHFPDEEEEEDQEGETEEEEEEEEVAVDKPE